MYYHRWRNRVSSYTFSVVSCLENANDDDDDAGVVDVALVTTPIDAVFVVVGWM